MDKIAALPDRFVDKIMPTPDGCWLWTGAVNKVGGYGRIAVDGVTRYAHREVYERLVGPITDETLDHLCRQPACVNPHHLEPVSYRTNTLRGEGGPAAKARQTHCKRGHPFSERNTYIQPNGTRRCKTCTDAALRRYWLKRGKDLYRPKGLV